MTALILTLTMTAFSVADIDQDIIRDACTEPLYDGPLLYPTLGTMKDMDAALAGIFLPADSFAESYADIVTGIYGKPGTTPIEDAVSLGYELAGREYVAWAYHEAQRSDCAALVIPGSHHNQSSAIFKHNPLNYQYDIAGWCEDEGWDTYVYVKPNEDFLAIHSNKGKLSDECLIPRLLNEGGSYSARYITDTLAWVKWLKKRYRVVAVMGLSQGGGATLLNAMQSEPSGAFIASGWTVLHGGPSGLSQIIIPSVSTFAAPEAVHTAIASQSTQYTFTWGTNDGSIYGYDAIEAVTSSYMADLPNVVNVVHLGGHAYPQRAVVDFLKWLEGVGLAGFSLPQNIPNPFRGHTTIMLGRGWTEDRPLSIFDMAGRLVRRLDVTAGTARWDGLDNEGHHLPAGVYTYHAGGQARKMVLAR